MKAFGVEHHVSDEKKFRKKNYNKFKMKYYNKKNNKKKY